MSTQVESWISRPGESHGPVMTVAVWTLCAMSAAFLTTRFLVKKTQRKLWFDDLLLLISWFFLLAQAIVNQLSIELGFGKHALDVNIHNFERIATYGAIGLSLSIGAITISKISFGVTLLRLTESWLKAYVCFAIATLVIFAIPAAILPWVVCKPVTKAFLDIVPGECMNREPSITYGRFQAVYSAVMDFSLALIPWRLLWNLQMRPAEKVGVGIAMSLGLLAGVAAILRGRYVDLLQKQDLSYDTYNSLIWSTAESSMTMVATSIPVLRVFFQRAINSATRKGSQYTSSNQYSQPCTRKGCSNFANNSCLSSKCSHCQRASNTPRPLSLGLVHLSKTGTVDRISEEALVVEKERRLQRDIEMDDMAIRDESGRASTRTPESLPSPQGSHKVSPWPL